MLPNENDHLPGETPNSDANKDDRRQPDVDVAKLRTAGVQGEGNYDAARNFNSAERRFVEQGKVAAAARAATPRSAAEQPAARTACGAGAGKSAAGRTW